ncbi:peptide ABC transporter ATP-binding protein (plasmid) [Azospirillum argentinense]|uniref:Peptide ABC transporter ATP-binding protein n=1 Tax=Azospirillum argentinense TaxID=2970906 RepID=A0A060DH80_9PROT|nr:ABC transporter ATP-binding protein [Azospirillum argentinense]AIB13521.1 peptide ABC transporter ATP-binding protein [Azospirillum argentinense]EZQ06160.1 peptide ABC transporter ATP-binding protein [Azospirillum argentinense]
MSGPVSSEPVLAVDGLSIGFQTRRGLLPAVRELSFSVKSGEMLAIVGESGCGKSLTALALLGLVPPPGRVTGGTVRLEGRDLLALDEAALRRVRGARISMIFQEPMTALNPVLTVGEQIMEAILEHEPVSRKAARERTLALLERVRIPDPERRFAEYPHRLSGGMRQRVMIAMALAGTPAVLVADEPTTALDVTIQAQILGLIDELRREQGTAVVFITHDLGVVSRYVDRVLVMYAGRKVEERDTRDLFSDPLHPYTRGLIAAQPRAGSGAAGAVRERLAEIPGTVPALAAMPQGCAFAPRCPLADARCVQAVPPPRRAGSGLIACHHAGETHAV